MAALQFVYKYLRGWGSLKRRIGRILFTGLPESRA